MKKIVFANGFFRSGSTFFFDIMRQSTHCVCFYEPFHPKINSLSKKDHSDLLGHSTSISPWQEHQDYRSKSGYVRYADGLPEYIVNYMGYYHPYTLNSLATDYILSLKELAAAYNKNIVACFNRAAFIIGAVRQISPPLPIIYVLTRRPSLQIARSLVNLYSRKHSYNLFSCSYRDPWGVTLLFDQHYTQTSHLHSTQGISSTSFSFLAKVSYLNTIVNTETMKANPIIFDITQTLSSLRDACDRLFQDLGYATIDKEVDNYLTTDFKQDHSTARFSVASLTPMDRLLLESVGFGEFL